MTSFGLLLATLLVWTPLDSTPRDDHDKAAKLLADVNACRTIADNAERLACFDRATAALAEATASKRVVVADRDDVRLHTPSPFADADGVEREQLNETIASIGRLSDGHVIFTLSGGSIWVQADDSPIAGKLKPGGKAVVKHGAFGSFVAQLDGRPGVKVKPAGR